MTSQPKIMRTASNDDANDDRHALYDLLKEFHIAMLVTRGADGTLHARPMSVAKLEHDGSAYFATNMQSPKIDEIAQDPAAAVSFQSSTVFASLTGTASVVRDRAVISELWSESWRVWFPRGKDDPDLCLIKLDPTEGEYWDNSGMKGIKYAFAAAKAYLSGERADVGGGQNAKVQL